MPKLGPTFGRRSAEDHTTLEGVRAELSALHLRNGIETFSDRMNDYHAKMEEVLSADYAEDPDGGLERMREDAAVLVYLAGQIADHPAPEATDARYAPLVTGLVASAQAMQAQARAGDPSAVMAPIGALKQSDAKFFLFFG